MFKQIVKDWQRENDVLTLTLQRDMGCGPPYFMSVVVSLAMLVFLVVAARGGSAEVAFGSLALLVFSGFLFSGFVFATTTFRFAAAMVQRQTEWFRFHWPTWEEPFVVKGRCRIYQRSKLPKPVSRFVFLRDDKELVPGVLWSHYVTRLRIYRYEIRFPLAERGGRGVICNLETKSRMNELQAEIDRFWDEVPVPPEKEPEIDRGEDRQEKVVAESEPMESFKDYAFNRGEDFFGHGDENFGHGAEPPQSVKPRSVKKVKPPKGERQAVTVREKFNERRNEKSLTLISERGGPVFRILGRTSLWLYRLAQLAFLLGVVGIFVYWDRFEPTLVDGCDRLNVEILKIFDLPPDDDNMMVASMKREFGDDFMAFRIFFGLLFVLPLAAVVAAVGDSLLHLLRWPFWGRWKIRFRHSLRKPHQVTFDWRTDRRGNRSKRLSYAPFFLAIPATPKTHRMISGRSVWDRNPGWRRPLQVVIITAHGSFPLPVAGPEEQRHVIELLEEFVTDQRAGDAVLDKYGSAVPG